MYKLAIVPKIHHTVEYSSAYGSQHDRDHIKKCATKANKSKGISLDIVYEHDFFGRHDLYNGVLFLGLSPTAHTFIQEDYEIDMFSWAFDQVRLTDNPKIFDNMSFMFEQSALDFSSRENLCYLPLAFQSDRIASEGKEPEYDIVINATLDRSRRATAKTHRRDLLEKLLKKGLKTLNVNGRAEFDTEKRIINYLKKYDNFSVLGEWGNPEHYSLGEFALNVPFHELGSQENINMNWGLPNIELENSNFLIHWDIFRCIGAKANMITFDCKETRDLGLNENSCHFYKSDTRDLDKMANEIEAIVKSKQIKTIDQETWNDNTYQTRWNFIFNKISSIVT